MMHNKDGECGGSWVHDQPLRGQTIAVTRSRDQAGWLCGKLSSLGAEVIEAPALEVHPIDDYRAVDEALSTVSHYTWLVLTSANGVEAMMGRLKAMADQGEVTMRSAPLVLAGVKVAAVGEATAERLRAYGIPVDLVPGEAVSEALAETMIQHGAARGRILLLRVASRARAGLVGALIAAGATCDDLPIYRTCSPASLPALFLERFDQGRIDWITLTSPSAFAHLQNLLGPERAAKLSNVKLASIGPVTTLAIRHHGWNQVVEANPHDSAGLVQAIVDEVARTATV